MTPAAPENSVDGGALDAETSNDIPLAPMEAALLERLIVDGKTIATELLRKQLQLEDLAVGSWARQAYSATVELGLAGDEFYRLENYQAAMDNYQQAMRQLDQLLAQVEEIQALNLERGETALLAPAMKQRQGKRTRYSMPLIRAILMLNSRLCAQRILAQCW